MERLFGYTDSSARVQNVGIVDASVTGGSDVEGLVGFNDGPITQSYSTGSISGAEQSMNVGGLVGLNSGTVSVSYSTSSVAGASSIGGLVGTNQDTVVASYATGAVTGTAQVGGLVGSHPNGSVIASYSTGKVTGTTGAGGLIGHADAPDTITDIYWDTQTSGQSTSSGGVDKTTSELQGPLDYTGIYANWNVDLDNADDDDSTSTGGDNPWDFGTDRQYPVLRADFNADGKASWEEFGDQGRFPDAPSVTSVTTEAADQLTVVWTAPIWDGGSGITGYDLRYIHSFVTDKSDANWTVVPDVAGPDALQANITDLRGGYSHDVQVRAVNSIGQGQWSETSKGKPNEAPSLVEEDFVRRVDENSPVGADVDKPIEARDRDGDDITFSISGDVAAFFEIDPQSGQLQASTGTQLDFETRTEYLGKVSVDDGRGGKDEAELIVKVNDLNEAPEAVNRIQDQSMTAGTGSRTLSLSERFSDPDSDALTYSATSSITSVVTAQIAGTSLALTPVGPGSATVTVFATDTHTDSAGVNTHYADQWNLQSLSRASPTPATTTHRRRRWREWRGPGPDPRTHTGANTRTYGDAGAYAHGDTRTDSGPDTGTHA